LRQYSFAKKLQSQTVIKEKLCKTLSYKKGTHKMLMKLTPEGAHHGRGDNLGAGTRLEERFAEPADDQVLFLAPGQLGGHHVIGYVFE